MVDLSIRGSIPLLSSLQTVMEGKWTILAIFVSADTHFLSTTTRNSRKEHLVPGADVIITAGKVMSPTQEMMNNGSGLRRRSMYVRPS